MNSWITKLALKYKESTNEVKSITLNQRILLLTAISIFAPIQLSVICFILSAFYIVYTKQLKGLIKEYKASIFLFIAIFSATVGSLIYGNYFYGVIISLGAFLPMVIIMLFYRKNFSYTLLDLIIKCASAMSIISAIIGLSQFLSILELDGTALIMKDNLPEERVISFYMNANMYAFVIELLVIMILYKLMTLTRRFDKVYYFGILVLNLVMLYFTGCRTAWIGIIIATPLMLIFSKFHKTGITIGLGGILLTIGLIISGKFPRFDTIIKDFNYRIRIWNYSLEAFMNNKLFGIGPQGYRYVFQRQPGAPDAIHSHSAYVESLVMGGIIGFAGLTVYLADYIAEVIKNYKQSGLILVVGSSVVMLSHGIFDVPILEPQAAMLFLFLFNSIKIPIKENNVMGKCQKSNPKSKKELENKLAENAKI